MKTVNPNLIVILLLLFTGNAYSQNQVKYDTIFQLNKELIVCNIISISELEIAFSYPNETITNTLSKKEVKEIHLSSGRVQKISDEVVINGEEDWNKVQLTTLPSDIVGLVKKGEVKGKAGGTTVANMTKVKERAEEQIKREAAKLGAYIVLIQVYNVVDSQYGVSFGRADINGIAYGYK